MDWTDRAIFRFSVGLVQLAICGLLLVGARRKPAAWLVAAIAFGSGVGPAGILRGLQDAGVRVGGIDMDGGPLFYAYVDSIPFL